jgi:hypothetical protein
MAQVVEGLPRTSTPKSYQDGMVPFWSVVETGGVFCFVLFCFLSKGQREQMEEG